MRILEINKFYFIKGGAERHFFDVTSLLQQAGHQVAVFSMHHPKNHKSKWNKYFVSTVGYDNNYTFWQKIKGTFRMFYSREAKRKINLLLDDFKPDVVHIHNIYHQLSPVILFEIKKRNIPIIMTVHDYKLVNTNYNLYHQGKFYNRCLGKNFYRCIFDKCVKNSYLKSLLGVLEMYWHNLLGTYKKNIGLYIAPSKFTKDILIRGGVAKNKIRVLPHFISDNNKNLKTVTGNKPDQKDKEKFCLYIGRVAKNKGLNSLIKIFEKVNDLKLFVAGEVDSNFKISNGENNKRIKFLGYLDKKILKKYINEAEFIISSSKLPETFGLIILEANSCGKPFVGYRTGAYPEIVEDGVNGFLASNNKEILAIINDITKKKNIFDGAKIKNIINKQYSHKAYLNKLTSLFKYDNIKY